MDATMMETDRHGPKVEYEHNEHPSASQDDLCPICHISVGAETPDHVVEYWASLPCGHRFGCHCLKSWLGMAEPPACPMCRQDMAHICGHPYLPQRVVVETTVPSGGGSTHVGDPSMKQTNADQTAQGSAGGAQDTPGSRRRSRRLMAKEAAAAAAAAAAAGRAATTAGPAVPVASAPIAIPASSTYQRPSTPAPFSPSPSSSPDSSSSSASSPAFSSSSMSSSSVPASPLSALSIQVAASSPADIKATTKMGLANSSVKRLSLETLFPRAPPVDAACTYCFGFLENQFKEELRAEEAVAAAKAKEATATTVEVIVSNVPADTDAATDAADAMDGSETLSDNDNEDDDDEEEPSDDDEIDDNMIMLSCSRKDRIVQMAMGVFASGCADPAHLSGEERRKVAAHWERWRISHAKMFSAWWAAQAPQTEPAIERRTQGWVH